jgi:hypothetical protein
VPILNRRLPQRQASMAAHRKPLCASFAVHGSFGSRTRNADARSSAGIAVGL